MSQNTFILTTTAGFIAGAAAALAVTTYTQRREPIEKHAIKKIPNEGKAGLVYRGSKINLARKILEPNDTISPHAHPGKQIVLTLIRGTVDVHHGGSTEQLSTPGDLATFFGDEKVSMKAGEDGTEFIVCLNKIQ